MGNCQIGFELVQFNLSNKFLLENLKSRYNDLSVETKESLVVDLQRKTVEM